MPFEIPQNLKYEEKLFFNLSFAQLFWIGLFEGIAAYVFFKTPYDFETKIVAVSVLTTIAIGFAFFDFYGYLKAFFTFLRSVHEASTKGKIQKFTEIAGVENDVIYMRNGSIRAVLQVFPINFTIMSQDEKNAIIHAYRAFLNALDFPVQIIIRTVKLDVSEYMDRLREDVNEDGTDATRERFDSFKKYLLNYIEKNDVKNRLFFVVVPFDGAKIAPPVQKLGGKEVANEVDQDYALTQLRARADLCIEKLGKCNLEARRLDNEMLNELFGSYFA